MSEGVSLGLSGSGVVGTGLGAGLSDFPVRGEPPMIARPSAEDEPFSLWSERRMRAVAPILSVPRRTVMDCG